MKGAKYLITTILLLATICAVFPEDTSTAADSGEEYSEEEFPGWLVDIRRGEVIAFGAFPIMMFVTNSVYSVYKGLSGGSTDTSSIFSVSLTEDEQLDILYIGIGLSVSIAITDWIIGKIRDTADRSAADQDGTR